MKCVALWLLLFGAALGLRAQSPDAEFLRIYNMIQEGETLESGGQVAPALERFQAASGELRTFARAHPKWNEKIIRFRLEFLSEKLGALKQRIPPVEGERSTAVATDGTPGRAAPGTTVPQGPAGAASDRDSLSLELADAREQAVQAEARASAAEARAQAALRTSDESVVRVNEAQERLSRLALELREARDRVEVLAAANANLDKSRGQLERERSTLQARLHEALSPKAAAVDPAELAKAEERILLLVKENEILKAGLDHQMAENRRVLDTARRAVELEQQLQTARTEVTALRRQTDELRGERQKLASKLDAANRRSDEQLASLRTEIEGLRKDLTAARDRGRGSVAGDPAVELASLRTELADQRAAGEQLRRENETLLREIEKRTDIRITPASLKVSELPAEDPAGISAGRYRRLERERDELRRDLDVARAELRRGERDRNRGQVGAADRTRELTREVARLEARVGALESKPDPYSKEELALFEAPVQAPKEVLQVAQATASGSAPASSGAGPAGVNETPAAGAGSPAVTNAPASGAGTTTNRPAASRRRTIRDLPPGASVLAAQAQRAFGQRRLDEAERAYREILKIDENNVFTLGNLAAIVVEQGRIEEGEVLLQRTLALDPQDPFSLSLLGILRFRQQRYDDAFDALSQAAQLDPEDPATQTYLGITLSERGQRPAAEAALRKALKLNPGSAAAHYNLSVVYATQKPPFLELARYHYEKARRAGQPSNPAFEAVLRGEMRSAPAGK